MKIAFVLANRELSGSETYCASLAEIWEARHSIEWVSDILQVTPRYHPIPICDPRYPSRLRNALQLRRVLKEQNIQVIHSHARLAHWVSKYARLGLPVAHVTTAHQLYRNHFSARWNPCLGQKVIAINESVRDYLIQVLGIPARQVILIRNGINLARFAPLPASPLPHHPTLMYVGRISGFRLEVIERLLHLFERIAPQVPDLRFEIVGIPDPKERTRLMILMDRARAGLAPERVVLRDRVLDIVPLLRAATLVCGAGRVAIEAMACGKAVLAFGERGSYGVLTPEKSRRALETNFGDQENFKFVPLPELEREVLNLLQNRSQTEELGRWGRAFAQEHFDLRKIAPQIEGVYQECISRF